MKTQSRPLAVPQGLCTTLANPNQPALPGKPSLQMHPHITDDLSDDLKPLCITLSR